MSSSAPENSGNCWHCAKALGPLLYGRGDSCPSCGRDTRVCKGCVWYDTSCNNACREPQADRVVEKEKSNFCDYFRPSSARPGAGSAAANARDAQKAAAEALFKKKP